MHQIQQQLLHLIFQDNKSRIFLQNNHFGDILFKENNNEGEVFKILQIYIDDNNLRQEYRFYFKLHIIAKNKKEYNQFTKTKKSWNPFFNQPESDLYKTIMLRDDLFENLEQIKSKKQDDVYVADKVFYSNSNLEDFYVLSSNDFYEKILKECTFNEDTLSDLTDIDELTEKAPIDIQKLYWGYNINRNANGLYDCVNLQNLSIWNESGNYLNKNITKLQNLSILSITDMISFPEEFLSYIYTVSYLVSLEIANSSSDNHIQLEKIPNNIEKLQSLKYLNLTGNNLFNFKEISKLKGLKELSLCNNQFNNLNGISNLQQLEILDLSNNKIDELSEELMALPKLKVIKLAKNPLKEIPDWLCKMTQLEVLDLTQTQLKTLPENIIKLNNLKALNLKKNPFSSLPSSILKLPKRILDLELHNVALYDQKARLKMEKYPTENCLFKEDFNLKLMVIQKLMYEDEVLLPKFDIWEFAKNENIDIEKDGYEIIPKAVEYFKKLAIPMELLIDIEELQPDGGDNIYAQIIPFWSGEDNAFQIERMDDIKYLPRLKRTNSMNFKKEHIKQLRTNKIKVNNY